MLVCDDCGEESCWVKSLCDWYCGDCRSSDCHEEGPIEQEPEEQRGPEGVGE